MSKLYWVQNKNSHSVQFSVTNSMRKQQLKMSLIIDVKIKKNTIKGELLGTKMYYMKVVQAIVSNGVIFIVMFGNTKH